MAPPLDSIERDDRRWHAAVGALLVGALTLVVHGFRVTAAPDLLGDEGLYFLVAHNLATGIGLKDDVGTFFWHPPGYPVAVSLWIQLTGSLNLDFAAALLQSRWLNVIFSACTAALLVVFGSRLLNLRAGLLMAAIFTGDLFVQRINRRSMLETPAILLVLLGFYLFYSGRSRVSWARVLGAGLAFGAAILTKEVAVVGLLALGVYVVVFQRQMLGAFARVVAIAAAAYSVYVGWALLTDSERFLRFKADELARILAVGRGVVAPAARIQVGADPGILERLGPALLTYAPTYLLLVIGTIATALLFLRHRDRMAAQLVLCWSGLSYVAIGFGEYAGFGDQFFYYVLVPAIVAISYLLVADWPSINRPAIHVPSVGVRVGLATLALAILAVYDVAAWTTRYAVSSDDGYARILRYVRANVPLGSTIVVDADVSNYLLRPDYDIEFFRDQASVRSAGVHYFILSTKLVQLRYNRMSPAFYDWVRSNTEPMIEVDGDTYWTLGLYRWVDRVSQQPAPQ